MGASLLALAKSIYYRGQQRANYFFVILQLQVPLKPWAYKVEEWVQSPESFLNQPPRQVITYPHLASERELVRNTGTIKNTE